MYHASYFELFSLRISRQGHFSEHVWIHALIYLDRLKKRPDNEKLSWSNVRNSLGTAIMLSHKFLEDEPYYNAHYAGIFRIQLHPEGISFFMHITTYYFILISDIFQWKHVSVSSATDWNQLERDFWRALDFDLRVTSEEVCRMIYSYDSPQVRLNELHCVTSGIDWQSSCGYSQGEQAEPAKNGAKEITWSIHPQCASGS